MLDQNVITLIATGVGGILATIGGIVATYSTQVLNNKAERKKFMREKCEEVYLLADQVKLWVDNEDLGWWYHYQKEFEPENHELEWYVSKYQKDVKFDCPIDKLMMTVTLHLPELRTEAAALKCVVNKYQHFSYYFPEQGWAALTYSGDIESALRDEEKKLEEAHQELRLIIEKTVLKSWNIRTTETGHWIKNVLPIKKVSQKALSRPVSELEDDLPSIEENMSF